MKTAHPLSRKSKHTYRLTKPCVCYHGPQFSAKEYNSLGLHRPPHTADL